MRFSAACCARPAPFDAAASRLRPENSWFLPGGLCGRRPDRIARGGFLLSCCQKLLLGPEPGIPDPDRVDCPLFPKVATPNVAISSRLKAGFAQLVSSFSVLFFDLFYFLAPHVSTGVPFQSRLPKDARCSCAPGRIARRLRWPSAQPGCPPQIAPRRKEVHVSQCRGLPSCEIIPRAFVRL